MITVRDIILHTDYESVAKEIKIHYGDEHMEMLKQVYTKLRNIPFKSNLNNMVLFIRVLKENEQSKEDVVIQDFDTNDNTLMFDVCGKDNQYDGLYSIASSEYEELLGYFVDSTTLEKFSYSQIIAHILWEIQWRINTYNRINSLLRKITLLRLDFKLIWRLDNMKAVLKAHSKMGIVSLSLCIISIGLSIFIKAIAFNYNTAFPVLCVMVIISITALIVAIVALRKDKTKKVLPIISIIIASFLILTGGFIILDKLLAILLQSYIQ